jgi:Cd2+/Zn2+-exporting ATPase
MKKKQSIIVVSMLVGISFILYKTISYHPVTVILMLLSTAIAGLPILYRAIRALRYGIVGIDALVSIAVVGAIIIGEYYEASAVTFLFLLGEYLESRTLEKTRSSITSIMALAPIRARILIDGKEKVVSPEEVEKGMTLIIKPGERVAVDGVVLSGKAYVDASSITGEPIPESKEEGQEIYSGSILTSGYLIIKATKVGEETTFAKILHLVEEAQDAKAPTQKFIEKFSRYYTPIIILSSIITYIITRDVHISLTLLVISCPGALVISVPVSMVAAIGTSAKLGILVKGGDIIERLARIDTIAFDKTGTLTIGSPRVHTIHTYTVDEKELLTIAAIGETYSEHPFSKAIIEKAHEFKIHTEEKPLNPQYIQGKGIVFTHNKETYYMGNVALFEQYAIDVSSIYKDIKTDGSVVIIGTNKLLLGLIIISDNVRPEAKKIIEELETMGIKKTIMLTGDNTHTAKNIAHELGISQFRAELLPEDKVNEIKKIQQSGKRVALVGDGINDAPSLALADVGIAIGNGSNDVAMETADVILLASSLHSLVHAIDISRKASRNMKQNIYFAIAVAITLLFGVLFSGITLSIGMLAHEVSVLLVILNAMRIMRYSKQKKKIMLEK